MQQRTHYGPLATMMIGCTVALVLTGCSGNGSSSTTTSMPDYMSATTAAGSEVSASVGSMSMTQSASAGGSMADMRGAKSVHPLLSNGLLGCGTLVVNATNAQGQVTDETITYALPACDVTGLFGGESLAITGALELVQPDPEAFNFSSMATNLEYAFTSSGVTTSETRNGTRQVVATSALLNESNNITTAFVNASEATGSVTDTLAITFTPASGSVLTPGTKLPDGTIIVTGGLAWTAAKAGATPESFTVTTVQPLVYDAACMATSASPFDAGQLKLVIADGTMTTYGRITWSKCGAPIVTVI